MTKVIIAIIGSIIGGVTAVIAVVFWFGWGVPGSGLSGFVAVPTRADYVDILLTVVTIVLGAIGLVVTLAALVVAMVAFKTLREIKEEAARDAKTAAADKINETLPQILSQMAQKGGLDEVFERVAMQAQGGGPEPAPDPSEGDP